MEFSDLKAPEPVQGRPPWQDRVARRGRIFAANGVPFDWGDAALAHPFSSLLVALRTAAEHTRLSPRSPELAVLTTSYLSPWLEAGYSRATVDRAFPLALRIAPLARALTWGRLFPCFLGHSGPAAHSARALAAMLEPDPLSAGDLLFPERFLFRSRPVYTSDGLGVSAKGAR
jgi:hypothetical protein